MHATWKTVRVFISSTFRDMQAERDHLVRFVFPRLREELLKWRIHFLDVDLRWGVTSEQDALEVCREIINECQPRFICILGGRYGWIPPGREHSITADEVRFGVFGHPEQRGHHFFYFRDPAVTQTVPESYPGQFREPPESRGEAQLAELKQAIRDAGYMPYTYLARWDPDEQRLDELQTFGDRVYQDLLQSIEAEIEGAPPVPLDEFSAEDATLEAFLAGKVEGCVAGQHQDLMDRLTAFAEARSAPSLTRITGVPGVGKSTLLAWFVQAYRGSHPDTILVPHFVGATPRSSDLRFSLRRVCHALHGDGEDLPEEFDRLVHHLARTLERIGVFRQVVLVFDQLDSFEHVGFPPFGWLPQCLPAGVRIIFSEAGEAARNALRDRGMPFSEVDLQSLAQDEARTVAELFLRRYHKQMDDSQMGLLLSKPAATLPTYLLMALEELRTMGDHEAITSRIAQFPDGVRGLFDWVLRERLGNDADFGHVAGHSSARSFVARFASLLAASRQGLTHQELVRLLDPGDPGGHVAALERLLRPYLARRGPLLDFAQNALRQAAREAYLSDETARRCAHRELADFFLDEADPDADRSWSSPDPRPRHEALYHLAQASAFDRLYALLTDFVYLEARCSETPARLAGRTFLFVFVSFPDPIALVCPACGEDSVCDGHDLGGVARAVVRCPRCRRRLRVALHTSTELGARHGAYSAYCPDCGRGTRLPKKYFADAVHHARIECPCCRQTYDFIPPDSPQAVSYRGTYDLIMDFRQAIAAWPESPGTQTQRLSLEMLAEALQHDHHTWLGDPLRLFPQLLPSLWWSPPDTRPALREACRVGIPRRTRRGPWVRQLNAPPCRETGFSLIHQEVVTSLHIDPPAGVLIGGTASGALLIVEVADGRYDTLELDTPTICAIGPSHTGTAGHCTVVGQGIVFEVDLRQRRVRHSFRVMQGLSSTAITGDGLLLAIGSGWGQVQVWDLAGASCLGQHTSSRAPITQLAFSGDDSRLLAINQSGRCTCYPARQVRPEGTFTPSTRLALIVPAPPDSAWWVVTTDARCLRMDHTGALAPADFTLATSPVTSAATCDGHALATGHEDGTVALSGRNTSQQFHMSGAVRALALSPDVRWLAAADDRGTVRLRPLTDAARGATRSSSPAVSTAPAYLLDGSALVVGSSDGTIWLLDPEQAESRKTLAGEPGFAGPAACAAAATVWAAIYPGGHWRAWDLTTMAPLGGMGAGGTVGAMALHPDGSLLVTGHNNGCVVAWDTRSGAERGRSRLHDGPITALAFSPDGMQLLSSGDDRTVRGWALQTRLARRGDTHTIVLNRDAPSSSFILHVLDFEPCWEQVLLDRGFALAAHPCDGPLAVGSTGSIELLNPAQGQFAGGPIRAQGDWQHLAFSADGRLLLGVAEDSRCALWHIVTRCLIADFILSDRPLGCAWHPDGQSLAVTTGPGAFRVFSFEGFAPGPPFVPPVRLANGELRVTCPHASCRRVFQILPAPPGHVFSCLGCGAGLQLGRPITEHPRHGEC